MKTKNVVIGLSADRIDILVCQGDRVAQSEQVSVALKGEPGKWPRSVRNAGAGLRSAIAGLGAVGLPARVLYRSPTLCVDFCSVGIKSPSEARQAAVLSAAELLSCPLDAAVTETLLIGRDASGDDPQTHIVVAADHDESLEAIRAMTEEAGLVFEAAVPVDAVMMSHCACSALEQSSEQRSHLYIGEHRSFFVIAGGGLLRFARPIAIGLDSFVSSLSHPIRGARGQGPITLKPEEARTIFHTHGIAEREAIVHAEMALTGAQLLPLIQPILQRFVIELRQSLRFALPEEQRQSVTIVASGPGRRVPNLVRLIADELAVSVEPTGLVGTGQPDTNDEGDSELLETLQQGRALEALSLRPQEMTRSRLAGRLRRWLWTGAATALAVIAIDTMRFHAQVTELRQQASTLAGKAGDAQALQSAGEKLLSALKEVDELEGAISTEVGAMVDLRACMQEIGTQTPNSIRLTAISIRQTEGKIHGSFNGYAFDTGTNGRTELEPFVERLGKSPLFESVSLANVQAGTHQEMKGHRFEAVFYGVPAPSQTVTAAAMEDRTP